MRAAQAACGAWLPSEVLSSLPQPPDDCGVVYLDIVTSPMNTFLFSVFLAVWTWSVLGVGFVRTAGHRLWKDHGPE